MTIKELKKQIEHLPDEMPVVVSQNDTPDLLNCDRVEIEDARLFNRYGYEYVSEWGENGLSGAIKVCKINGSFL